jgi:hypothetical protein
MNKNNVFWEYIPNINKSYEKTKKYFLDLYNHYNDVESINVSYFGKDKKK